MVGETTGVQGEESQAVLTGDDILQLQDLTRQVPAPETVVSYAVAIASASRPKSETCDEWTQKRVKWGAGSRGSQALILGIQSKGLAGWATKCVKRGCKSHGKKWIETSHTSQLFC